MTPAMMGTGSPVGCGLRVVISLSEACFSIQGGKDESGDLMIAGVDIGGTKIAVGMVDDNGRVREQQQCATDAAGAIAKR